MTMQTRLAAARADFAARVALRTEADAEHAALTARAAATNKAWLALFGGDDEAAFNTMMEAHKALQLHESKHGAPLFFLNEAKALGLMPALIAECDARIAARAAL